MTENLRMTQAALLFAAALIFAVRAFYGPRLGANPRRALLAVMLVLASVSVASHFRWGAFNRYANGNRIYHYHDLYHYAIGAKYYPELGYHELYNCTLVAFDEMKHEIRGPSIISVRRLSNPDESFPALGSVPALREVCLQRFGTRWAPFKADLTTFLKLPWSEHTWREIFFDLGFNPPPSWNVIGHTLIADLPITERTMSVLPFVDLTLLFVVAPLLVGRAWGVPGLAAYLVVLGCNVLAHYGWNGGSYFRQVWFGTLACGVATLRLGRPGWAGMFMGVSAAIRVFPLVFVLGVLVSLGRRAVGDRGARTELAWYAGAGLATGLSLVGASLVMFDPALWADFFHKIGQHGDTYYAMHVGFKKLATFDPPSLAGQNWWWADGLHRFVAYNDYLHARYAANAIWYDLFRGSLALVLVVLASGRPAAQASLVVGGGLLYLGSMPANYYYVYLALLPVVFLDDEGRITGPLRQLLIFGTVGALGALHFAVPRAPILWNGYVNATLLAFWILLAATLAWDLRGPPPPRRSPG